jgi:hypothetical protein
VKEVTIFWRPTNVAPVECAVSALGNVDGSPESFDCLQIPSETKTLLLSMAKTRLGLIPTVPFDDVIDGKGQGLNILLEYVGFIFFLDFVEASTLTCASGPPGVGKTFTVEATSEYFQLPLYSVGTRRGADCGLPDSPRYPQVNLSSTTETPMRLSNNSRQYSRSPNTLKPCFSWMKRTHSWSSVQLTTVLTIAW